MIPRKHHPLVGAERDDIPRLMVVDPQGACIAAGADPLRYASANAPDGNIVVIAGREIPSTVFSASFASDINTPVLPALITALLLPSRTSFIAMYMDVSWA